MKISINLQHLYKAVIKPLQGVPKLKEENSMRIKGMFLAMLVLALLLPSAFVPSVHAWSWDDDENGATDELDIQVKGYRKRVEEGISLQERVVLLDRLIKLYKVRGRDAHALEQERADALADEKAVQTVGAAARQKSQSL